MSTSLKRFIIVMAISLSVPLGVLYLHDRSSDNFYECKRIFQTDKEVYQPGDTIKLTVLIIPEKKKTIKIYDNFKNLEIDMTFHRPCDTARPAYHCSFKEFSLEETVSKLPTTYKTYTITPEHPYQHTFYGMVAFDVENDEYMITFSDYGYSCRFKRKEYEKSNSFCFHGQWYPINADFGASLEEFIEHKPIKLQTNTHYAYQ